MDELGSPQGQAVVVCFATYVIRPAFKFDVFCVCGDSREAIQRHLSFDCGNFLAKLEKDGCRYRLFADGR